MHPARQKRLGSLLLLLATWFVTFAADQPPRDVQRPPGPPKVDQMKEAKKGPPLSAREEWTKSLPSPPSAPPGYDAEHAYIPLQDGQLVALSLDTGEVAWSAKVEAAGSPVAGAGLVMVPAAKAILAFDALSGQPRWRVALDTPLAAPLTWDNGWLFAGVQTARALMLRAATGEILWQRPLPAKVHAAAAMTGDRLYVPLENGHVVALQLARGETLWDGAVGGRPTTIAPLDDRVFVGSDDKFFYCLSAKNGKVDWRWRTGGAIVGRPAIDEDHVYFVSLDNVLRALDRSHGAQAWHAGIPFRPSAGPFLNGRLLIVSGLAEMRAYQYVDGSQAGAADLPDVLAGPPHFLAHSEDGVSPFILVSRDGRVALLGPVLESKPFPPKPLYPLWPEWGEPYGLAG